MPMHAATSRIGHIGNRKSATPIVRGMHAATKTKATAPHKAPAPPKPVKAAHVGSVKVPKAKHVATVKVAKAKHPRHVAATKKVAKGKHKVTTISKKAVAAKPVAKPTPPPIAPLKPVATMVRKPIPPRPTAGVKRVVPIAARAPGPVGPHKVFGRTVL